MNTTKKKFVLTVDGHVISEPMAMKAILEAFGPLQKLEASGCLLVEVKPSPSTARTNL